MKRRILAIFLSLCMLVGLLPVVALASDGESGTVSSAACSCETLCTEEAVNVNCPVCVEDYSLCAYVAPDNEEEPVSCTKMEGCTLENGHEGECITSSNKLVGEELESCIDDLTLLSEDEMSGNCGAIDSDNVTWKLEQNNDDSSNPTYTLTFTGTGDITWDWRTVAENSGANVPPYYTYADKITKVVVGEGITGGARAACAGFTSLTEVTLPSTFSQMGNDMFSGCTSLTSIDLPASLTSIGNSAFRNCTSLRTVNFAPDTGEITITGFYGCTALESITLPNKVTSIKANAFEKSGLKSITIAPSVSCEIGKNAFANCTSLVSVTIGENVTTVGQQAFYSDTALTTVSVAAEEIGQQAFGQCTSLANVELKEGVTTIGDNAFATTKGNDNGKLTVIRLPSTVTSIGTAFNQAYKLETLDMSAATNITFPSSGLNLGMNGIVYVSTEAIANSLRDADSRDAVAIAVTNGGIFMEDTMFSPQNLETPTKEGAIFDGWYENANFTGDKVISTSNGETYYAKWIGMDDIELQYGGEQQITVSGVSLSSYQSDDQSVATVDETGKVKAVGIGTATISATGIYNEQTATFMMTVTVVPRELIYSNADGTVGTGSISYNYSGGHHTLSDFLTFKWADEPGIEVILAEGTDINYTYTVNDSEAPNGGTELIYDYLPMPVGIYKNVRFNLLNENYTFALSDGNTRDYLEIDVNVAAEGSQRAYLASAWPKTNQTFVYTGDGVLPVEGTLNAYSTNEVIEENKVNIGTFTVNIEGLNDTSFHSAVSGISAGTDLSAINGLVLPTEPGTYIITASAVNNAYYLYKSLVFTISKATVTVKADDKTVYVGYAMPEMTYTVSGLARDDSLITEPTITCDVDNTNTAGTYTITANGAVVPNENHYNSEIVYQPGTLTILRRGGGSSGSSSSGSHTTSTSDDVSIVVSDDNVTTSQIESAVNKADEGSTITIKATSSNNITLPVDGLRDVVDNDNDVLIQFRYGEITLSTRAIEGMIDGTSSNEKIKVSITKNDDSTDEIISELQNKDIVAFDVSVKVGDKNIHSFDGSLTLTFTVPDLSEISDPHILHILNDGTKEYYVPDRISGNTITVKGIYNLSTFAVIPGSSVPTNPVNPFVDVYESDYYYDAVLWAVNNDVTSGTSATTFGPNAAVTRAQMVTFLWRAHGAPKTVGSNPFTDVSTSDYYYDAVLWAVTNGVTSGTSATTFSPDMEVTRAQAVTFQWRAAGSPMVSGNKFGDVVDNAYYVNAVAWAVANEITSGTSATTFSPDMVVTRAQAVTFLYRELA